MTNEEIFEAAKKGDKSILKLPKEKLMIKNADGWNNTPIHWLAHNEVKEILKLDKDLLMIQDKYGRTPIHEMASVGVKEILKLSLDMLTILNKDGWTPVHYLADNKVEIPEELKQYI